MNFLIQLKRNAIPQLRNYYLSTNRGTLVVYISQGLQEGGAGVDKDSGAYGL